MDGAPYLKAYLYCDTHTFSPAKWLKIALINFEQLSSGYLILLRRTNPLLNAGEPRGTINEISCRLVFYVTY